MLLAFLFVFLAAGTIACLFSLNALYTTLKTGLPYVSTPDWAIEWLRKNVQLNAQDVVYEWGCGDARVLSAIAASHPSTSFIGIEIQWWPYLWAKWRTRNQSNVQIIRGDFLKADMSTATLVYGFFITVMMPRVAERLSAVLQDGARVISFGFALPGWTPTEEIPNPKKAKGSKIRIYKKQ